MNTNQKVNVLKIELTRTPIRYESQMNTKQKVFVWKHNLLRTPVPYSYPSNTLTNVNVGEFICAYILYVQAAASAADLSESMFR